MTDRAARLAERGMGIAAGAVLIGAASGKILAPLEFAWAIARQGMLPAWAWAPVAVALPWMELAVGVCLVAPCPWRRGAWGAGSALFALFTLVVARLWLGGIEAPCGCFGAVDSPAGPGHAAFNALAAVFCVLGGRLSVRLQRGRPR